MIDDRSFRIWSNTAPWPSPNQIRQDLVTSCVLVKDYIANITTVFHRFLYILWEMGLNKLLQCHQKVIERIPNFQAKT